MKHAITGFESHFQSCIMKNSNKILLLLVPPEYISSWAQGSKHFEVLHAVDCWKLHFPL